MNRAYCFLDIKSVSDEERPTDTGIYEIVNLSNGHRYVGSAVSLRVRWNHHRASLARGTHHSRYLQKAWHKYGETMFVFRPLLLCHKSDLITYEQAVLDAGKPEYNIVPNAGSSLGHKLSSETKAKIAAKALGRKRSPETIAKIKATSTGRKLSPSHVAKLIGNKRALGSKHTEEWKAANSLRNTGVKRPKSPEQRAKSSAALKGIPHSPERRAKQALAQTGLKRKPYRLRAREVSQ